MTADFQQLRNQLAGGNPKPKQTLKEWWLEGLKVRCDIYVWCLKRRRAGVLDSFSDVVASWRRDWADIPQDYRVRIGQRIKWLLAKI